MRRNHISFKKALKLNHRALSTLYKHYPQMIISRFISIIWISLSPYVSIYLSALVIDELADRKDPERLKFLVLSTLVTTAVIALVSAFLNKWRETQNAGLWRKVDHIFSEKLLNMDYVSLDETKTAELLSTIHQNQGGTGWGLQRVILNCEALCSSVFTLFGGVSLTVSLFVCQVPENAGAYTVLNHPAFVFLMIAAMLLITYIAPALSNKAESYWALNVNFLNHANRLYNFFGSLGYQREFAADMRIYRQDKMCEKCNQENRENTFGSKSLMAKYGKGPMGLYKAAASAVSVIFTGFVYAFVCLKAWAGAFGLGAVTQYIAAITKVSGGVSSLVSALGSMRNNASFLVPVYEFLDIPNTMYQGSLTVEKRRDYKYEIEFRNVSFRYPGSDAYALRNVNIKFEIGKRLAVVGRNGSGKTTLIKLLCRLYDPTEGEILLNGIDIRKYNYMEYMSLFSVVFQDFKLFSFRLGQNVAASVEYDRERAAACLEKAGFGERLQSLPKGLDTCLYKDFDEDGVEISGGEAQKIALARALYKNAPFIILDEPTAALDPVAEYEVYSRFNEIVGEKTAVYISHRLSSCRFCDAIAVFDNGMLVQQGSHEALLSDQEGKYRQLWYAQAQYYTETA